jgi:hypothetical protein
MRNELHNLYDSPNSNGTDKSWRMTSGGQEAKTAEKKHKNTRNVSQNKETRDKHVFKKQ